METLAAPVILKTTQYPAKEADGDVYEFIYKAIEWCVETRSVEELKEIDWFVIGLNKHTIALTEKPETLPCIKSLP